MIRVAAFAFLLAISISGCRTARIVRERLRHDEQTTAEATETTVYEGQPVETAPPPQPTPFRSPRTVTSSTVTSTPSTQNEIRPTTATTPRSSATPRSSSSTSAAQFPVAKPVPGKPGYVFSPYDPNGGYVDVTGYQSGSKVKDPYSQKIFLVP
jgi:hypothetical protein